MRVQQKTDLVTLRRRLTPNILVAPDSNRLSHLLILRPHADARVEALLLHMVEGDAQVDAILEEGYSLRRAVQQNADRVACIQPMDGVRIFRVSLQLGVHRGRHHFHVCVRLTTSLGSHTPVLYVGPYFRPCPDPQNECPSSPW